MLAILVSMKNELKEVGLVVPVNLRIGWVSMKNELKGDRKSNVHTYPGGSINEE